ncbi:hypothetical protein [Pseudoalteromonas sp. PPB1]|uniref:hypothetical protein n=1 Tax=Pseudoalteromonas sp. PPB1 TaxID=2756136 RepID=UPI001E59125C|nr:hypothetical protein [Pseudoalteromonas sp. PPB1]
MMNILRNKAWRRFKAKVKSRKNNETTEKQWSAEKNWKLMYTRSEKLRRAKQLGIEYSKKTVRQTLDSEQPLDDDK